MYKYYLFDLDHTLFDFNLAEDLSLKNTFLEEGIAFDERLRLDYDTYNKKLWKDYEALKVTREELLVSRFEKLFEKHGIHLDAKSFNEKYLLSLSKQPLPMKGAKEVLEALSQRACIVIATNGPSETQREKLKSSGLYDYVDFLITSEDAGITKPHEGFFTYLFKTCEIKSPKDCIMIGDNPYTDIFGAKQAGMDTCLFDPEGKHLEHEAHRRIEILTDILK